MAQGFVEAWNPWQPIVQADVLDKRGTLELLDCAEEASESETDMLPSQLADLVARQTSAFTQLRNAFVLYRGLYHCATLLGTTSSTAGLQTAWETSCDCLVFGRKLFSYFKKPPRDGR